MPAVGRARTHRRLRARKLRGLEPLPTGRPRGHGGRHLIQGIPKSYERTDPETGAKIHYKSSKTHFVDLQKDRRIRAKPASRTRKEPHYRGDVEGSKI
jgi:hypothetical protein